MEPHLTIVQHPKVDQSVTPERSNVIAIVGIAPKSSLKRQVDGPTSGNKGNSFPLWQISSGLHAFSDLL